MDIPVRLGGLAVRPGGHLGPPLPARARPDRAGLGEPTDTSSGAVIVFHCLTPHAALANTGAVLRLSGDFRWQRAGQAPAELVLLPARRAGWRPAAQTLRREMFSRMFRREPWWEPVPAGLMLVPRAQLAPGIPPGPSRFFAVHPGWRRWRPPPGVVH